MSDTITKQKIRERKNTLENREKTYDTLSKRWRLIAYFGILLVCSSFVFVLLGPFMPSNAAFNGWLLMFGGGFLTAIVAQLAIKLKGVPQIYFSPEDEIFLKVFDAITSLETYMKDKDGFEPARNQSIKELHGAYKLIKYHWEPSKIAVVVKEIGDIIETFKERFDKKLVSTLKNSTKMKKAQTILAILYEFGDFLIDPNKEKLVNLNEKMNSLPYSEEGKPSYRIIDFLKRHQIPRHTVIVTLFFSIGLFPALFVFYSLGASINTAVQLFVGVFGPLISGYIIYLLKKE